MDFNGDLMLSLSLLFSQLTGQRFPVWDDRINTIRVLRFGDAAAVTPHTFVALTSGLSPDLWNQSSSYCVWIFQ